VKKDKNTQDNNLVLFPASKNYPVFEEEILSDPLQELLDEFSDIEIDLDESYDDFEEFESDITKSEFTPLLNRGQQVLMAEKVALIRETQQRIKYLLDEIELYLPRK